MPLYNSHKVLFALAVLAILLISFVAIQALIIKFNGRPVPVPEIPRGKQTVGQTGPALTFAVLGDSTAVSQGGNYAQGYAVSAANLLGKTHRVTYQNFGVSGARVADVLRTQVPQAVARKPDIVLIGVGANDVTHFTNFASIERDMQKIANALYAANPNVKIIITGSPQMGSVPRFPQPAKWLAKQRTTQVNAVMRRVANNKRLIFVPIADKTGPVFAAHPELFAKDKFHPTTEGYKLWAAIINNAL